jgi:hypothetical protein
MKLFRPAPVLLLVLLAGCMGNAARNGIDPGRLDVFGVAMYSPTDYREIGGVRGTDEPCLRGYERSFDSLDVVIGYGRDGKVRKIGTRNPQTSMFEVHPGDTVASARDKIRGAGFSETGEPNRFRKRDLVLTILANGPDRLFGLVLESTDPPD